MKGRSRRAMNCTSRSRCSGCSIVNVRAWLTEFESVLFDIENLNIAEYFAHGFYECRAYWRLLMVRTLAIHPKISLDARLQRTAATLRGNSMSRFRAS